MSPHSAYYCTLYCLFLRNYLLGMGYSALVFAIFNASVNPLYRERCGICSKLVYKHQQIVVRSVDGKILHAACFGFDRDAFSIFSREHYLIGFVLIAHVIYFPFMIL